MTDRTTLLALAERCEQAAGPDRELDFAIAAGAGWPDSPNLHQHARRYTESLDAAVTLVPDGWDFCISKGWAEEAIVSLAPAGMATEVVASATTPAPALCAAALRARAAANE
jgi:hypothetical protein